MSVEVNGPWSRDEENPRRIVDADGRGVAEIPYSRLDDSEEVEEKGRLIVAAPDLLGSLKTLIKDIDDWEAAVERVIGRPPNATWGHLEEARAIVAKVEGRHG